MPRISRSRANCGSGAGPLPVETRVRQSSATCAATTSTTSTRPSSTESCSNVRHAAIATGRVPSRGRSSTAQVVVIRSDDPYRPASAEPETSLQSFNAASDLSTEACVREGILRFAQSFNGYEFHGSFIACAQVARARRRETMTDLRTELFTSAPVRSAQTI